MANQDDTALKQRAGEALSPAKFVLKISIPEGGPGGDAERNRDIVANAYRATLAGDKSALTEILHPDVVFREPAGLPYGVEAKGVEAVLAGVQGMFNHWSSVEVEIVDVLAANDLVIAYMKLHNVSRSSGAVYEGPLAECFRFEGDKVIEWFPCYWDTHAARMACSED